jgi:hypothetical protein
MLKDKIWERKINLKKKQKKNPKAKNKKTIVMNNVLWGNAQ